MNASRRLIKRYANRKLYDTVDSRYVTLEQIAALVRNGEDVVVIDKTTDDDLTSVTLAQIIFEEEKQKRSFLPLAALRKVIQTSGESLTDLKTQITESAERVGRVFRRDGAQEASPQLAELNLNRAELDREGREWLDSIHRAVEEWQKRFDGSLHQVLDTISPIAPLNRQVYDLAERVTLLERELKELQQRLVKRTPKK